MKNHYLKIIIGSILMLITAGSFNFQSDKSIYLTELENSEIPKSLEFKEIQEVVVSSPVATEKEELPKSFFASNEGEGQIGVSDDKPIDNPIDNIFHVNIEEKLRGNENIWLEYELKGVQDYSGISRSINDQLSVGGYLVKKSDDWVMQKELINPNDLKLGDNVIRFTIADNKDYGYQIRNLGIRIEPYSEVQAISNRRLVVNQPSTEYYYGKLGYFQGLVIGDDNEEAKVLVNGEKIRYQKGTFESLVEKPINSNENWTVRVQAIFPDGQELYVDVPFNKPSEWDYKNGFDKEIHSTEQLVSNTESFELQLANAKLKGDSGCIDQDTKFSITALRDIDVPALDAGMVNVTAEFKGYRFLPHGNQFSENVFVELGYDTTLIPQGYTEHDIKTYFFDENSHHWVALPKDSLLLAENTVKSITYHFTDMINGIIKVPESPETQGYTPTSMKDVKAANPATGINLINPPTANSMGNANLSYPLNIPSGRQGMQPQLAISYNSGGGNGWLGMGWNLSVPSISADTRWGVPRFDSSKESETYVLSGQQLSPVSHRSEWEERSSEKQFFPRIEGSYSEIIRHGDKVNNYWWEVTDKNGIKYFYGGHPDEGVRWDALLADEFGNISNWALVEIRDLNDNFVSYKYDIVVDTPNESAEEGVLPLPGRNLYISKITYTGHGDTQGKYSILFTRDRSLGGVTRKDYIINARYGFKQLTADLLRKIEIQYNGTNIRSYKLEYKDGAFYKTLLESITEYDSKRVEFSKHEFDYFDDVKSNLGYVPFASQEVWNTYDDTIKGDFGSIITGYEDKATAISGTRSNNWGAGFVATTGPGFDTFSKNLSSGSGFSYSASGSKGLLALVDINGDGLSDKLIVKDEKLFYRSQLLPDNNGKTKFNNSLLPVEGSAKKFLKETSYTNQFGFEVHIGAFFGTSASGVTSKTLTYFSDVNADGLIDIVDEGKIYFNRINANGNPEFSESSENSPNPIVETGSVNPEFLTIDPQELEDAIDQNPLHDAVRMWQAPFDGTIDISSPVHLIQDFSSERSAYLNADGVRVAVQLNGNELWSTEIEGDDYQTKNPTGISGINVNKGDRIYFRVQSRFDGAYDNVSWNPTIQYSQHNDAIVDANNKAIYKFNAEEDFILVAKQTIGTPIDGRIKIDGNFIKPITTDDIKVEVIKIEEDLSESIMWETVYTWDSEINEPINFEMDVDTNDIFTFKVSSQTNIDWGKINWMPHSYYIDSYDPDFPSVTDGNGNPSIESYAVPEFSIYANQLFTPIVWEASEDDTISIAPLLEFNSSAKGNLVFSVKSLNKLIAKQTLTIDDSIVSPDTISVIVTKGDKLFIDYHTSDTNLIKRISGSYGILFANSITDTTQAGLYSYISESLSIFGQMYRNWGQFVYNGNRDRALQAINEADLKINDAISDSEMPEITEPENYEDLESQIESANIFNPREDLFILMVPNIDESNYQGYDEDTWVKAVTQSSSRLGEDNISHSSPYTSGTANLRAITKKSMSLSRSYSWAASLAILSYGNNSTTGTTNIFSDFMDMNGDRYPDVVTDTKIQYTEPHGGLSEDFIPHGKGVIHSTEFESEGTTFGARYTMSSKDVSSDSKESSYSISGSASTSGSYGDGSDEALFSWMDINGDGLTDRVHKDGIVELNLGYRFAPKEIWEYTNIRKGESDSKCASGGVSINISNSSFESGVGKTRSDNKVIKVLQDVNGDGLVDEITETDPLKVRLNLGSGFSEEISWGNLKQVNVSSTIGESLNTAFTVGFTIWYIKVCINGRSILNRSFNRQEEQIADIDGDGFPDYISSDKENELKVYRSTIGKTNLLKSVKRPLRANFELAYEKVGNTFEMPQATWALSKVTISDGHTGDGANYLKTSFKYEAGYHDRHEREFYGFKTVKTNQLDTENNDAVYRTIVKEFANDSYYTKGLLLSETIQDANENKFIETVNEYKLKNITTMQDLPDDFEEQGINIALPALIETNKYFYEGNQQAQKSTKMTFAYGDFGNVVAYTDFGDPDITEDNISSTIDYWKIADKNILSVPKSIAVTGGDGKTYRKRETSIDDDGKITQIRQYLNAGQPATFDLSYNNYGNLDSVIRPVNYNGDRMYFAYDYDNVVHSYITNVRDAYGYNSSTTYDYRFGQIKSTSDINGQQTVYEIDDLGRITKITGPYELESGQNYTIRFAYHHDTIVPWAHTQHYDPAHPQNPIETALFIDGLGRVLQTKKDGAIFDTTEAKVKEVMLVSGKVIYDAFGRSIKSYYPVSESKGRIGKFNTNVDKVTPTKVSYDIQNRTKTTILPDIATTEIRYGFGEDRLGILQFMTTVEDAEMKETTSYTDIKGLQTAIKAPGNVWTSFVYNSINELKEVTDAEDNITVSEYDMFGRRVSRDHPDAGLTEYTYDLSGNMLNQTTANLRKEKMEITYEYDYSRLSNINYPQNPENNVRFEYGESGEDYNRAGRIVVQEDATGAQEFFYGNLGEITKNIRTIIVPDDGIFTFVTEWEYDTWNRLTSMIYPDDEEL
ncbi:MAG: hypothetical protein GQ564_08625, partial [Bacteroidales bacterium]|nr:hypothetical protein [Bacteroidales bacterium]